MSVRFMLVLCALALLRSPVIAQTSSFGDTWILFDQVSITGNLYSNAMPKMTTIHWHADSINFTNLETGQKGEDIIEKETFVIGSTVQQKVSDNAYKKLSATPGNDNNTFSVLTEVFFNTDSTKPIYRQSDNYQLTGKQMILIRKAENLRNGEMWECKGVYEKRDEE